MNQLKIGDPAPNFALQTVDGNPFSLHGALRSGQNVLLVFLRHLG
jgi:peroxiredoxin